MVLPDSHEVSRAPRYSGTVRREKTISLTGLSPSVVVRSRSLQLSSSFLTLWPKPWTAPQPPLSYENGFGLFPVRSPLLGESRLISFPGGTEMCHFPPFASHKEMAGHYTDRVSPFGHPRVQSLLSSSPGLFAACHALRRVSAPRHPPHALSSLPAVLRWSIPLACIRLADLPTHDVKEHVTAVWVGTQLPSVGVFVRPSRLDSWS